MIKISKTQNTQVKITVDAQLAQKFKSACIASDISITRVLTEYMVKYSRITQEKRPSSLSTKRQRRAAIEKIMQNLEQIKESEERYRERIPENLQSSTASEAAEQWIDTLEEVIGLLGGLP